MIPYDQLVAGLTSWRRRKGLPVAEDARPREDAVEEMGDDSILAEDDSEASGFDMIEPTSAGHHPGHDVSYAIDEPHRRR